MTCCKRGFFKTATQVLILSAIVASKIGYGADEDPAPAPGPPAQNGSSNCLEIYPYLGVAIDNFAASSANDYFNHEDSGETKTRETFGVWFQYPLGKSDPTSDASCNAGATGSGASVWLYGQTAHGVRSAELDCSNSSDGICSDSSPSQSLGILRDASSLEAMLGIRWEPFEFQNGNSAGYFVLQSGFVSVEDGVDDAAEISHVGFGARIRSGDYRNSFVEIGIGKNDLILDRNTDRIKINARLVKDDFDWFGPGGGLIGFIHIAVDVDGHSGPDSIQTYLGITY